jgi:hypothetical protein
MSDSCILCEDAGRLDELGLCRHCRRAFRAEIEEGLYRLQRYLICWDRFRAWCLDNGVPA